jgi:HAD superfamily hydrolase (TIGR01509 family)
MYSLSPQIKEILFDCDNTLVLSEELAFQACAQLGNEILEQHGVSKRYTGPELMKEFVGQNFRGVVKGMETRYNFTLSDEEREKFVKMEEDRVIAKLEADAQPCVGANEELDKLYAEKKYGLAVVSSSALRRVVASVKKVDQAKYFPEGHIFSAATSLPTPTTKPDPAIYLWACEKIGVKPSECVAVEDSKSGTLSAVRAGIYTIAYTGSYEDPSKAHEIGQMLMDNGACMIMTHWSEFDACLKKIEAM